MTDSEATADFLGTELGQRFMDAKMHVYRTEQDLLNLADELAEAATELDEVFAEVAEALKHCPRCSPG